MRSLKLSFLVFVSLVFQSEVISHPASCPSKGRVDADNVSPISQFLGDDNGQRSMEVNITVDRFVFFI